jgi:hypothetical protein
MGVPGCEPSLAMVSPHPLRDSSLAQDEWFITLNWKQGIFAHRTPCRLLKISRLWLFIHGTVLWTLWIEMNNAIYNGIH